MKWISADVNPWDLPVVRDIVQEFSLRTAEQKGVARTVDYWVDMASGDELLLLKHYSGRYRSDVGYSTGRFHLFRYFAQTNRVRRLSHLLDPIGGGRFSKDSDEVSQQPEHVRAQCVRLIEALIEPDHTLTDGFTLSRTWT